MVALLIISVSSIAQNQFSKKPIVKNYGSSKIASSVNFSGLVLPDNTLLFANEKGVLKYNGSEWDIIPITDNTKVVSLLYKDSAIYVAGEDEFGYLKQTQSGVYEYVSFKNYFSRVKNMGTFFQIVAVKNQVYFQSYGMIYRWDGNTIHFIPLEDAYIFNLNNKLYASIFGQGIAIIENDEVTMVNTTFKLADDAAFNMFTTKYPNVIHIYTGENGFYSFNITDYSVTPVSNVASQLFKEEGYYFGTKFLDSLWVASTWDGSVVIFNENGEIVRLIDKSSGITGKFLRELFIDNRNKIWVTSDVGISEIYWPEFDTLSIVESNINHIEIEGNIYAMDTYPDSLLFDDTNFKISFSATGFNQDEVQYSYKLDGQDNEWSKWSSDNTKEYTGLKGGNYLFRVKCKTFNGLESEDATLVLTIHTAWYKTTWAFIGYVFISFGMVGLITWLRTIQLRISNRRLESLVAKRTGEINIKSQELTVKNEDLNVKNQELDQFVYRSSHDLIAPLKSLKGLINLAKSDAPQKNQLEYLKHMETSVLKLEDFINSIIDFTTNVKTKAEKIEIKLDDILNDVSQELKYFDRAQKVELIRTLEVETIWSDPKRLKIILNNLISNSVKYHNYRQEKPFIEIKSYRNNGQIFIEVKDNGQGIKPEFINNIFDMFYRASDSSEGSGLGLYIVKDTVAKINGELKVDSTYGEGSIFTLSIPL